MRSRALPIAALALPMLTCPSRAFVRGVVAARPTLRGKEGLDDRLVPSRGRRPLQVEPSFRARGGAFGVPLRSAATSAEDSEGGDSSQGLTSAASGAMEYCAKMSFLASAVTLLSKGLDVLPALVAGSVISWEWADGVDVAQSLAMVLFGGGIWRMSRPFRDGSYKGERTPPDVLAANFRTSSRVWGAVTASLALASVSLAATLPTTLDAKWNFSASSQEAALVVGVAIVVGTIALNASSKRACEEEILAYKKKMGEDSSARNASYPARKQMRAAGIRSYQNKAICAGAFGLLAVLRLIAWVLMFDVNVVHFIRMLTFLNPFIMSKLLFDLNEAWIRAAIVETGGESSSIDRSDEVYSEFFTAQSKVYRKGGNLLRKTAIFTIASMIVQVVGALKGAIGT